MPTYYENLDSDDFIEKIRGKAATSVNAAGVFLAFSIAVLVAVMGSGEYRKVIMEGWQNSWRLITAVAVVILRYFVSWRERILSRAGDKSFRYFVLIFLLGVSII